MDIDKETRERLKEKILQEFPKRAWRVRTIIDTFSWWESHDVASHLMQWCDDTKDDFQIRDVSIYSVMELRQCSYFDALPVMEAIYECEQIADFYKPDNELYYRKIISNYPININKFALKLITEGIRKGDIDEVTEYAESLLKMNNPIIEPLTRKYIYYWIDDKTPDFSVNGMSIYEVMKNMNTSYYETLTRWMNFLIKNPMRTLHAVCPDPKKLDLINSVVETAATLFLCLADIAQGSSSQASP